MRNKRNRNWSGAPSWKIGTGASAPVAPLPLHHCVWLKNGISYNSCQYSFVIASVGFNMDRVTTQHTLKCVENCSDRKVSIIVYLTFTRSSVTSVISLKTAGFFLNCALIIYYKLCLFCTDRDALTDTECFC